MRLFSIPRHHQRWPAITFHNAGSRNSNDSAVPSPTVDHHAVGITQARIFREAVLDGLHDPPLFFLALTIQFVQTLSDFAGTRRILHAEQLDDVFRNVHAARGVGSGRNPKTHFARPQGLATELRDF